MFCKKSTLLGLPANQLNRLQKIQNAAARIVTRTKSREHITPVLRPLRWLPVTKRIEYKIPCLTYQWVHKTAPQYLQELVFPYNPPYSVCLSPLCRLNISEFGENTNKKCSEQSHSTILHPPSGTSRQTSFTKQKTLLPFVGSWKHICFQLL